MKHLRVRRGSVCAALVVAWAGLAIGAPSVAVAQKNNGASLGHVLKKTLLVFPFDMASEAAPNAPEISMLLTDAAASRLIASKAYSVTTFYKEWAPVKRLHTDQSVNDVDLISPFAEDNRKALKIGKLVGYDAVCVGSVDDYQYNEADKQVTVTVSGRVIEVETGKVLKSVTLSSTSPKGGEKAKEEELNVAAARDAADRLLTQLAPPAGTSVAPVETKPVPKPGRKSRNEWVWLLALGVGLGLGLSGGGGGGGGIDNPPPPP